MYSNMIIYYNTLFCLHSIAVFIIYNGLLLNSNLTHPLEWPTQWRYIDFAYYTTKRLF